MSISVRIVPLPPLVIVSARRPWIRKSPKAPGIATEDSLREEAASTAWSRPSTYAYTVRPSFLTMSGSSTPASCTLVVEESGAAPPPSAPLSGSASGSGIRGGSGRAIGRGGGACRRA